MAAVVGSLQKYCDTTRQLDTARQKKLGMRVKARPVRQINRITQTDVRTLCGRHPKETTI